MIKSGGTSAVAIVAIVVVAGLFVVAIVGILAAIAIPNLLTAMQRAKQKRTMADVRTVAVAVEAYATDNSNKFPDGSSIDDLRPALVPKYIPVLPAGDGWGNPLRYHCLKTDGVCGQYILSSGGKDGRFEHEDVGAYLSSPPGPTTNFDCDIIYSNGEFIEYPQGFQRQ